MAKLPKIHKAKRPNTTQNRRPNTTITTNTTNTPIGSRFVWVVAAFPWLFGLSGLLGLCSGVCTVRSRSVLKSWSGSLCLQVGSWWNCPVWDFLAHFTFPLWCYAWVVRPFGVRCSRFFGLCRLVPRRVVWWLFLRLRLFLWSQSQRQRTLRLLFEYCRFIYFHLLMKSAFLPSKGLLCLYDKQNNTWLLIDMEFFFSCLTRREIPFLRPPTYYSLFILL